MLRKVKKGISSIVENSKNFRKLEFLYQSFSNDSKHVKVNIGQLQAFFNSQKPRINNLSEIEFQVFSQGGEDGIIQYLIDKIEIPNKTFIEFGVENYRESNTRFLLINNNWSGLVIDGSPANIHYIEHEIAGQYELYLSAAFITKDNINDLLRQPGFDPEIGLLSIDIDGNDYWIWKEITGINPVIVVCEYNSVFGKNTNWTVPYDPAFVRREKHPSQLYYGASLKALVLLAEEKGYTFIGCNTKGNNAFFVRNDKLGNFVDPPGIAKGYVRSKFREARDDQGWITGADRIKTIAGLKIVDLDANRTISIDPALVQYE